MQCIAQSREFKIAGARMWKGSEWPKEPKLGLLWSQMASWNMGLWRNTTAIIGDKQKPRMFGWTISQNLMTTVTSAMSCCACRKRNILYRRKRKCRFLVKRCIVLLLRRAWKLTLNQPEWKRLLQWFSAPFYSWSMKSLCDCHETA